MMLHSLQKHLLVKGQHSHAQPPLRAADRTPVTWVLRPGALEDSETGLRLSGTVLAVQNLQITLSMPSATRHAHDKYRHTAEMIRNLV